MHPSYYHQAHACILVFDATRKNTYKNLANWYTEMRNHRPSIPCICAVNKIDGMHLINSFNDLMLKPTLGVRWGLLRSVGVRWVRWGLLGSAESVGIRCSPLGAVLGSVGGLFGDYLRK